MVSLLRCRYYSVAMDYSVASFDSHEYRMMVKLRQRAEVQVNRRSKGDLRTDRARLSRTGFKNTLKPVLEAICEVFSLAWLAARSGKRFRPTVGEPVQCAGHQDNRFQPRRDE